MVVKNSTRSHRLDLEQRHHGSFFYFAVGADPYKLVESGLLPLSKSQAKALRSKGSLPKPGDSIIVLKRVYAAGKPVISCRHELISLCQVLHDLRKAKPQESQVPRLNCVLEVTESSIGKANQTHTFKPSSFVDPEIPTFIPASEDDYRKAIRKFPLSTVCDKITHSLSKTKLNAGVSRGYVYDLQQMKLCKSSEIICRVDNSLLEKEVGKRVLTKDGYEMVDRLHKRSLQARGSDLGNMDWEQVEDICAQLVGSHGFYVQQRKRTNDGGVDFVAIDRKTPFRRGQYIFQVKRTRSVGVDIVKLLDATLRDYPAVKGIIMTTGHFTRAAHDAAATRPIELIDGDELSRMCLGILPEETEPAISPNENGAT